MDTATKTIRTPKVVLGVITQFRIGKRLYMLVDTTRSDIGETLADIAQLLVLSPETLLDAIVSTHPVLRKHNEWAVAAIYDSDEFWIEPRPFVADAAGPRTTAEKRALIRHARREWMLWHLDKVDKGVGPGHYRWRTPSGTLAVPVSSGFEAVLANTWRYRAASPQIGVFNGQLDKLVLLLGRLRASLGAIDRVAQNNMGEVGGLMALSSIADVCLEFCEEPARDGLEKFKMFVDESAVPVAVARLLTNPTAFTDACVERDKVARAVLELLAEPLFTTCMKVVIENRDIVDPVLHERIYLHLEAAAALLSRTALADAFVDRELLPAMQALSKARSKVALGYLADIADPAQRAFFDSEWAHGLPKKDTAFAIALAADSILVNTVTNVEGPMSLGVAVFTVNAGRILTTLTANNAMVAAPHRILQASLVRMMAAHGEAPLLSRLKIGEVLAASAEVSPIQRAKFIENGLGAPLSSMSLRSATARGFSAAFLMVVLTGAIKEGADQGFASATSVLQTVSALGGAGLAVADLSFIAPVLARRLGEQTVKIAAVEVAAMVATIGLCVSFLQWKRDSKRGDVSAKEIDLLNLWGGGVSFIGWGVSVCTTSGGGLWWAGCVVAAIGALMLVTAGILQVIDIVSSARGPEACVYGVLVRVESREPLSRCLRGGLEPTLDVLHESADDAHFGHLPERARASLSARGFDVAAISALMAR